MLDDRERLQQRIKQTEEQIKKTEEDTEKINKELEGIRRQAYILQKKQERSEETPQVMNYLTQKETLRKKQSELENWIRKVEIARQAYVRAKYILKQHQEGV